MIRLQRLTSNSWRSIFFSKPENDFSDQRNIALNIIRSVSGKKDQFFQNQRKESKFTKFLAESESKSKELKEVPREKKEFNRNVKRPSPPKLVEDDLDDLIEKKLQQPLRSLADTPPRRLKPPSPPRFKDGTRCDSLRDSGSEFRRQEPRIAGGREANYGPRRESFQSIVPKEPISSSKLLYERPPDRYRERSDTSFVSRRDTFREEIRRDSRGRPEANKNLLFNEIRDYIPKRNKDTVQFIMSLVERKVSWIDLPTATRNHFFRLLDDVRHVLTIAELRALFWSLSKSKLPVKVFPFDVYDFFVAELVDEEMRADKPTPQHVRPTLSSPPLSLPLPNLLLHSLGDGAVRGISSDRLGLLLEAGRSQFAAGAGLAGSLQRRQRQRPLEVTTTTTFSLPPPPPPLCLSSWLA